jgi:isopentenyl diphosphate isomerase/L-lactate dehydrogenase-like FMN-dependent dehydrogenase
LAASFVARAEAAGYGAIVVTLDTPLLAWRPRDLQGAYLPFLKSIGIANYLADPVFRGALEQPPEEDPQAAVGHFVGQFSNPAATWDGIDMLRSLTTLPLVLKGINHPDDAREARERGVDGVLVSNHGGRQVDGALGAIDALPGVVEAVGDDLTVLFDSGVRGGADVLKAMALGADAALIGRPYLWGLALAGADGVKTVIRSLLAELDLTLALSGHSTPATVGPEILTRRAVERRARSASRTATSRAAASASVQRHATGASSANVGCRWSAMVSTSRSTATTPAASSATTRAAP